MADDLTSKMAGFAQAIVDPDNSESDAYRLSKPCHLGSQIICHRSPPGTAPVHGCRSIVRSLEAAGVFTTKSSVHRLIHGQAPYQEANDGR